MDNKEDATEKIPLETRTSATVYTADLQLFKSIARLKFSKDPMNNAWKESVNLFIQRNKHILKERYDELMKDE